MQNSLRYNSVVWAGALGALFVFATVLVSCGGTSSSSGAGNSAGMGTVNVSLTDPPSCAFPNGSYTHVYVAIRSVQANISSTAGDNDSGWRELTPQLNTVPLQIDLFAAGPNACLLTMLGSTSALPAGTYQQIRLLLVPNDGGGGPVPASNACGSVNSYNCVQLHDGTFHPLLLSSQANTGLKIPPGQVQGGPIAVSSGQDVDLNIDFNACSSIVVQGNGEFRLKPVLTAGQVGTNSTGISGQIVDAVTKLPVVGGTVLVALENQDASGTDVISRQVATDSQGNFNFCPLPTGSTFDVVVAGINGTGSAYNATIAVGVPGGTNLGAIPLAPETGASAAATTFHGFVTASSGAAPATIDASISALQTISLSGGSMLPVTIPAEGTSLANISVETNVNCPVSAPLHSNCAAYTLIEPASNPSVGVFSAGKISFATPASGSVPYSIRAQAFVPMGGGTTDCTPASLTTNVDSSTPPNALKAVAGTTESPKELDFGGCS